MKPRIKVITLGVSDLDRSLTFYRDGLGLPTPGIIGTEFASMLSRLTLVLATLTILLLISGDALAQSPSPAQAGESLRADLRQAQLTLSDDPAEAQQFVANALGLYQAGLAKPLGKAAPEAHRRIRAGFAAAEEAVRATDSSRLAMAQAQVWTGLLAGLVMLGFTSVYREGFEVVLFLQAPVLEGGLIVVLSGVGLGLVATVLVGLTTFVLQARLPYKKMLIATGIMIGGVLLVMMGHTVHSLQVVGWLPIHALVALPLPYWTGIWFGLYPTWEGILLQAAAATFVIGSYYLAEWHKKHRHSPALSARSAPGEA